MIRIEKGGTGGLFLNVRGVSLRKSGAVGHCKQCGGEVKIEHPALLLRLEE